MQRLNASPEKWSHYGEPSGHHIGEVTIQRTTSSTSQVPTQLTHEQKGRSPDTSQNCHSRTKWSMMNQWTKQHLQIKARLTTCSLKERGPTNQNKKAFVQKRFCSYSWIMKAHLYNIICLTGPQSHCNVLTDHLKHAIR
jgi:hypothetical protein